MRAALLSVFMLVIAFPATAFERVSDAREFARLIEGRVLTRVGLRRQVSTEGQISGRGFGYPVTGAWRWENGFFCRDLGPVDNQDSHLCRFLIQASKMEV